MRDKQRTAWAAALILAVFLISPGCATEGYNKYDFNLMTIGQEDKWGDQLNEEVKKEFKKKNMDYHDRVVEGYVNDLGQELSRHVDEVNFDYTFSVVKTKDINAFALPAGHIYIHTGLIEAADSEAELAGVVAHEIAHVVARHSSERFSAAIAAQTVGSIIIGTQDEAMDKALAGLAVQIVSTGGMLAYSRAAESEADRIGARIMYEAGWDPKGMASFFETLEKKTGDMSRIEVFLSTHPDPGNRRKEIRDQIKDMPEKQNLTTDSAEFRKIRERLSNIDYPERPES